MTHCTHGNESCPSHTRGCVMAHMRMPRQSQFRYSRTPLWMESCHTYPNKARQHTRVIPTRANKNCEKRHEKQDHLNLNNTTITPKTESLIKAVKRRVCFFLAGDHICIYILNKNLTETSEPARYSECLINEVKCVVFLGGRSHLHIYTSLWLELEGLTKSYWLSFGDCPKKKRYTRRFWGTTLLFWRLSRPKSSFLKGSQGTDLFLSLAGDHIYTYSMPWKDWPTSSLQKATGLYIYTHMRIERERERHTHTQKQDKLKIDDRAQPLYSPVW